MTATEKQIKAFAKFNDEIKAYATEFGEEYAYLYEDAFTTRQVKDFRLFKNGKLTWMEKDFGVVKKEEYRHIDEDDIVDSLKFWRACFRRAKKYDTLDPDTLDAIQDGRKEDIEED